MEFLDIGDKIKRIRKELKLKQEDLSDVNLTRGFISMIEGGRRIPNDAAFNVIIDKFKSRAEKLGMMLEIDKGYLGRTAEEDAKLYCIDILKSSNSADDIKSIIAITKQYHLIDTLADAYMKLGDIIYANKEYINAFVNYMDAFDCYNSINNEVNYPYLYNRMGLCKLNQLLYLEASTNFKFANHYATLQKNDDIRKKSLYNIALSNKKLGNIEKALKYIDDCLSICDKKQELMIYTYANILKANCYETQGILKVSIQILETLVHEFENKNEPLLGYIYSTLGSFYLNVGNFSRSLEYFDASEKIRKDTDKTNLSHSIIEKSYVYIKQNLYENAIALLQYGFELATESNDLDYQLKAYYELADIYIKLNRSGDAEKIYTNSLSLLSETNCQDYSNEKVWIYSRLSRIYLERNERRRLREVLEEIQRNTVTQYFNNK